MNILRHICVACLVHPESSLVRCLRCREIVCQQCAYDHVGHPIEMFDETKPHAFLDLTTVPKNK